MRFKKARDVLNRVKSFHQDVSARCQKVCEGSDDERVRILLNYVSEREQNLARAAGEFTDKTEDLELDTWFQYATDDEALNSLLSNGFKAGMAPQDLANTTMTIADHLLDMYRDMLKAADTDELRRVFQDLIDHEQKDKEILARNLQMFEDL